MGTRTQQRIMQRDRPKNRHTFTRHVLEGDMQRVTGTLQKMGTSRTRQKDINLNARTLHENTVDIPVCFAARGSEYVASRRAALSDPIMAPRRALARVVGHCQCQLAQTRVGAAAVRLWLVKQDGVGDAALVVRHSVFTVTTWLKLAFSKHINFKSRFKGELIVTPRYKKLP